MKKRLLSAFLALAMVLTLLPVAAFADTITGSDENPDTVDDQGRPKSTSVTYQVKNDPNTGKDIGKWYWSEKVGNDTVYHAVVDGVVASTGNSGRWYPSMNYMLRTGKTDEYVSTTITLLKSESIPSLTQNLTVDINGYNLTIVAIDEKVTSLKVTDSRWNALVPTGGGKVIIADMSSGRTKSGMTITLSNVKCGGINVAYRNNTVNLTNETRGSIVGGIDLDGDNSTISLTDVTGGSDITLLSNGGSVTINGTSSVGEITAGSRETNDKKATAVPSVTINGGSVTEINRPDADKSTTPGKITIGQANSAIRNATVGNVATWNGEVTVNQATVGTVYVTNGKLTLNGPVKAGDLFMGAAATNKVEFTVTGTGGNGGKGTRVLSLTTATTCLAPCPWAPIRARVFWVAPS